MDAVVLPNKHFLRFGCAIRCAALWSGPGATAHWLPEQLIKFTSPQFMAYRFRAMDHSGVSITILLSRSLLFTLEFLRFRYSIVILRLHLTYLLAGPF